MVSQYLVRRREVEIHLPQRIKWEGKEMVKKKNKIVQSEILLINNLLNKDYYKDDNQEIFQNALKQIKPFKNITDKEIPLELLEKLIYKYELKYAIMINYICPIYTPDMIKMYSVNIRDTEKGEYLLTIYGSSIYETFCKIALYYYMKCNVEESIGLKDWGKRYET